MPNAKEYMLPDTWTFRAHCESNGKSYKVSYFHVMDLNNIHDWVTLKHAFEPGKAFSSWDLQYTLQGRTISSFSLFKNGIRPEWEDAQNQHGFTCSLRGSFTETTINTLWNDLLLEAVRGGLAEHIQGIQITQKCSRRMPSAKIDVWCSKEGAVDETLAALNKLQNTDSTFSVVQRTLR